MKQWITIQSTQSQSDYVANYSGVDKNDRDGAEYSTTIQTNCWDLRIFFWIFDWVIHMLYTIVIYSASCYPCWKKYTGKNYGRAKFQKDLGMQLIMPLNMSGRIAIQAMHDQTGCDKVSSYLANARSVSFVWINTAMVSITNQLQQPRYLRQLGKKEKWKGALMLKLKSARKVHAVFSVIETAMGVLKQRSHQNVIIQNLDVQCAMNQFVRHTGKRHMINTTSKTKF